LLKLVALIGLALGLALYVWTLKRWRRSIIFPGN